MSENQKPTESQFGKEWISYGSNPGLKTRDLINLDEQNLSGISVLPGISIGSSLFHEFIQYNDFRNSTQDFEIEQGEIPPHLSEINQEILSFIPKGIPIAIRSSATDERGGTGIYYTTFYIKTGDTQEDLAVLEENQKSIFASFFSSDKVVNLERTNSGMGMLIHPVVGDRFGDYFMPSLSGVLTLVNDEPILRLVIGLGTKAVETSEAIVLKKEKISDIKTIFKALQSITKVDVVNLNTTQLETITIRRSFEIEKSIYPQVPKLVELIRAWQKTLTDKTSSYWEFAIDQSESPGIVVQHSPENRTPVKDLELEPQEGTVLFEGTDVVNIDSRKGRGIIQVGAGGFSLDDMDILLKFNQQHSNYLLILPDTVFSGFFGLRKVSIGHFSNAAAIVELQYFRDERIPGMILAPRVDHTGGRGGDHFTTLTSRNDILFLGVVVKEYDGNPQDILGTISAKKGTYIAIWDQEFKITNTKNRGRVEILREINQKPPPYDNSNLIRWFSELDSLGKELTTTPDFEEVGKSFQKVSEFLLKICDQPTLGFNPFRQIEDILLDQRIQLIKQIQLTIENLYLLESYGVFQEYEQKYIPESEFLLEVYLRDLLEKLRK